jgi:hypothetical protein
MARWRVRHERLRGQPSNVQAELGQARHERDAARRELETARRPLAGGRAAINPAEWEAACNESGEFPDAKVLTFGHNHRFENPAAILAFGLRRPAVRRQAVRGRD